jgi:hypothetical protein
MLMSPKPMPAELIMSGIRKSKLAPISSSFSSASTVFCLTYFLSKRDQLNTLCSPIQKSLMKLELKHRDTYGKTFLYANNVIYFSHKNHIEKSAAQVYILLSQFSIVNENMKQTSE